MSRFDVIILTDSRYLDPSSPGQYVQNILKEDQLVRSALELKGLQVDRKDWADPMFDWSDAKAILFRSTWDYFDRFGEFSSWLNAVSKQTLLINSHELINWNVDKHYLNYLVEKGVRVVPTRYIEIGSSLSLQRIHDITGWTETVIKPTVGGAGRHTYRIDPENLNIVSQKLDSVLKKESFMLQPFQHSIIDQGEISLVFFGKNFSHAVLKKAQDGEFRVQDDFGGTVHSYNPSDEEISFGQKAIQACPQTPAYSRVDYIIDNTGELAISELELVEPELWFRLKPEAADVFADEIIRRITAR